MIVVQHNFGTDAAVVLAQAPVAVEVAEKIPGSSYNCGVN